MPHIPRNKYFQQSLEAGVSESGPAYAVLEYRDDIPLRDVLEGHDPVAVSWAETTLQQLIGAIWIPVWNVGLRFKDCHPGNFFVPPSCRQQLVMIDTEQMRKSAFEFLDSPDCGEQRERHEGPDRDQ